MTNRIEFLHFDGAPQQFIDEGIALLKRTIDVDTLTKDPDVPKILFFLSGGSERQAIEASKEEDFCLLVAYDLENSYAAATEVKSYLNKHHKRCKLIDLNNYHDTTKLKKWIKVYKNLRSLRGKRIGLLGEVSPWLINSSIDKWRLQDRLGIQLEQYSWEDLGNFKEFEPDHSFIKKFNADESFDLDTPSKVYSHFQSIIKKNNFDAITVECFSLVNNYNVTGCLALSHLSDLGIPAGCEGDITSIVGMLLCKEITGEIPWMANIIKTSGEETIFAHCTIPLNLTSRHKIMTHYETSKGTSIEADYKFNEVTVFRLDNNLGQAFITVADITKRPKNTNCCRTQISIEMEQRDVKKLKTKPLGNHHLILSGDKKKELKMMCRLLDIELI